MTTVKFYDKGQTEAVFASILPDTTGATAGQVLTLNANLEPIWS